MNILILNSHSHSYSELASLTTPNHLTYCRHHNYEYLMRFIPTTQSEGIYGNVDFRALLLLLPHYNFIMTIGTDTLFMNHPISLESIFPKSANQQIATESIGGSPHNNDIMLWRHSESTSNLIHEILSKRPTVEFYHPFNWQMQLNNLISSQSKLVETMNVVNEHVMNSYPEHFTNGDLILHAYNRTYQQKINCIKKFLPLVKLT